MRDRPLPHACRRRSRASDRRLLVNRLQSDRNPVAVWSASDFSRDSTDLGSKSGMILIAVGSDFDVKFQSQFGRNPIESRPPMAMALATVSSKSDQIPIEIRPDFDRDVIGL